MGLGRTYFFRRFFFLLQHWVRIFERAIGKEAQFPTASSHIHQAPNWTILCWVFPDTVNYSRCGSDRQFLPFCTSLLFAKCRCRARIGSRVTNFFYQLFFACLPGAVIPEKHGEVGSHVTCTLVACFVFRRSRAPPATVSRGDSIDAFKQFTTQ